jgi:hypothetical protein
MRLAAAAALLAARAASCAAAQERGGGVTQLRCEPGANDITAPAKVRAGAQADRTTSPNYTGLASLG